MNSKMKKLSFILAILLMFGQGAFADCVSDGNKKEEGKIKLVASGLILLNSRGEQKVFKREVSDDYFDDTMFYKTKLFGSEIKEIPCRINKIGKTNVKYYTQDNKLKTISKLKVKNMEVKIF